MKKNLPSVWVGVAVFFAAAIYSVVLFLLKSSFDAAAWVLYSATMIAFLLVGIQAIAASRAGAAIVLDVTLGIVTVIYFGIQFVFGGVICMCFSDLPLTPVIVAELILLAVYLIIAFLMYAAQSSGAAQDQAQQDSVRKIRLLESDVRGMAEEASDPSLKQELKDLAEMIHFSVPSSLPGLADVDGRIAQNVVALQDDLADESADPLARIEMLRRLLKERDRTAAILKR